ncbi:MAG: hypothetical protein FWG44_05985 [Oscillospiraceae bacterium]|nr:hypothetical protein [Oscillospiraceae bacterium]
MTPSVNIYQMTVGNREFLLADVARSAGIIGTTIVSGSPANDRLPLIELLYAADEALINLTRPAKGDEFSDKLVNQVNTINGCDENIKTILSTVGDNYFTYSQNMSKSLQPALEILSPGIYVCHEAKMIPSDGAGNFFWSGYTMKHEVSGTAVFNHAIGKESNYIPGFLIPTTNPAEFSDNKVKTQRDKLNAGKKIGGLALHLSGMFCALLDGHHSAAACLLNDTDFKCLVIEPLREVLYESAEAAAANGREPRIIALSCPFVKIPISEMPPAVLESFLLRRANALPRFYSELKKKAHKSIRIMSRKSIPKEIHLKAELLPDRSMIESAYAVTELTDEQLEALLAGEIKYDDKIIISQNYYNSIVTACNYLQYEDFERFLKFSFSIIDSPDLTATHKYVIERLCTITNKKINAYFIALLESNDPLYDDYKASMEAYVKSYSKFISDALADKESKAKKLNRAVGIIGGEISDANLAQMESFAKVNSRRS